MRRSPSSTHCPHVFRLAPTAKARIRGQSPHVRYRPTKRTRVRRPRVAVGGTRTLRRTGEDTYSYVHRLHEDVRICVRVDGEYSEIFDVTQGMSVIACLLFNAFFTAVIHAVQVRFTGHRDIWATRFTSKMMECGWN